MFGMFLSKVNNFTKFFGIFFILFLSGCVQSQDLQSPQINEAIYQVSAPWDLQLYDSFYTGNSSNEIGDIGKVVGGIIPHHLIAGHLDATFFEYIKKQNPSTIVLIGPNHFDRGYAPIISTGRDWKTPYGITETNIDIVEHLIDTSFVEAEEEVVKEEHSVYSLIPFITRSIPEAKVVPLILKQGISQIQMDHLIGNLLNIVPEDTIFVSSIDFSHYQIVPVADFHDELSISVIKDFDFTRLDKLEIDSIPSLYVLLKIMEVKGAEHVGYELHTNSGKIVKSPGAQNTTSHYSPFFVQGKTQNEQVTSLLYLGSMPEDHKTREAVFEQLSGQEDRFFSGMDYVLYNTSQGLQSYKNFQQNSVNNIADFFETFMLPEQLDTLVANASIAVSQQGYAVGILWYPTYISLYIFPVQTEVGDVSLMEYGEAQKYLRELIDRYGLEDYTFNSMHTTINL
ncbi:MAG: AmmeMemoRadiSam system protein B [Candidatus Magasanikbacteria bacterium]|nr:AmmeMemoRadiSam system protein B [Candidatus Magasanikbacteria bacterium]